MGDVMAVDDSTEHGPWITQDRPPADGYPGFPGITQTDLLRPGDAPIVTRRDPKPIVDPGDETKPAGREPQRYQVDAGGPAVVHVTSGCVQRGGLTFRPGDVLVGLSYVEAAALVEAGACKHGEPGL